MHKVLLLPGDGIGPEVIAEARKVLSFLIDEHGAAIELEDAQVGGCAYEDCGDPLPEETLVLARAADAVVLVRSADRSLITSSASCDRRRDCCACVQSLACLRTCARRSCLPSWPMPLR